MKLSSVRVALTVIVGEVPLWPSYVPVIVTVPTATAVTVPDDDTVATPVLLDDQLGVTVAVVPSLYVAVALTVVVSPTVKVEDDTLTDRLDTVAVGTTTLIVGDVGDPGWPPQLIIAAVPINRTPPEQTPRCLTMKCRELLYGQLTNSIVRLNEAATVF